MLKLKYNLNYYFLRLLIFSSYLVFVYFLINSSFWPIMKFFGVLGLSSICLYLNDLLKNKIKLNKTAFKTLLDVLEFNFLTKTMKIIITSDKDLFKEYIHGSNIGFINFILKIREEDLPDSIEYLTKSMILEHVPKRGILKFVKFSDKTVDFNKNVFAIRYSQDYEENLRNLQLFVLWVFYRDRSLRELEDLLERTSKFM